MFQTIVVVILVLAAIFYLGRMIVRNLQAKSGCASNCNCGVDFNTPLNKN